MLVSDENKCNNQLLIVFKSGDFLMYIFLEGSELVCSLFVIISDTTRVDLVREEELFNYFQAVQERLSEQEEISHLN